eukprot:gnl/TRDRNA2_/TRDRNA2_84194_c0_seq1.p1 gnl/TRDRNA2_/TRDRNA2_84194_c0~~gnl/TRDRNA2_/TRDRNA2_84194_c0_seq1.p1  ORF type:complete len:572 (+),score=99.33 gnl/TRDRNA2_/TRDRNA2_84194_c0_seq1:62-1777(+)
MSDGGSAEERPGFGAEAEIIGSKLDEATDEFLKETKSTRILQIQPGMDQLTALEFVAYLGIDLTLEPELTWIAREMLATPMPPSAMQKVSKSGVVYFQDVENDYFTIEHPLTQRFLKVLERQRLDLLVINTKPSVRNLFFSQPDMLFHNQFRNLQIPCQSCGVMQSTLKCHQCLMSFCQPCFDVLHSHCQGPRKNHKTIQTAVGSMCSTCAVKKPQVYCANCEDYFCFKCFEDMHRRGNRLSHKSMLVTVSDGEMIEPQKRCEECTDKPAAFACDYCLDNYCVTCFWKCHFNGHRRNHTTSKICVQPLCNQCNKIKATVFCEQCQELMCSECFTFVHKKGNRQLHLFMDAMDLLVLLERLDPSFQEHMRRARPRVLWAISQLQGWVKGLEARRQFQKRRDVVTMIQRRWRGARTRRKLLEQLHMHKWRRRQVSSYFLPKSQAERGQIKQKVSAMLAAKDVSLREANTQLVELRNTIMQTAGADPLEDVARTKNAMTDSAAAARGDNGLPGALPQASQTQPSFPTYTSYDSSNRFKGTGMGSTATADLSSKDLRSTRDTTLRQITRLEETKR